jgi:4-hydroxy-3-methylbut-2-en-1-yl diphosphate synthase IspG/GcpE
VCNEPGNAYIGKKRKRGMTVDDVVAVFKTGNATVRIHPGKYSKEEREERIRNATREFLKEVQKAKKKNQAVG